MTIKQDHTGLSPTELRRLAERSGHTAAVAARRAGLCVALGVALVAVSSAYNLRSAHPSLFGVMTFLAPPLALAVAAWLAHSTGSKPLMTGAVGIAVTAFGLSSRHIYHGALLDGADGLQAAALPVIIDGLAIMLTLGYLQFRSAQAGHLELEADHRRRAAKQTEAAAVEAERREHETKRLEQQRSAEAEQRRARLAELETMKASPPSTTPAKISAENPKPTRDDLAVLMAEEPEIGTKEAAIRLGVTDRSIRRWKEQLEAVAAEEAA